MASTNASATNASLSELFTVTSLYEREIKIWFILMVIVSVIGAITGLLIIICMTTSRTRSKTQPLLLSLLVIATTQYAVGIPLFTLSVEGTPYSHPVNDRFCSWSFGLFMCLITAVDWADLMISLNRLIAICYPHYYRRSTQKPILYLMTFLPILVGVAMSALQIAEISGVVKRLTVWRSCTMIYKTSAWAGLYTMVPIAIPFLLSILCYFCIFITITRHRFAKVVTEDRKVERRRRQRYRKTYVFFAAFMIYNGCILPGPITGIFFLRQLIAAPFQQLILRLIALSGFASMPVIYFSLRAEYRHQMYNFGEKFLMKVTTKWRNNGRISPTRTLGSVGTELDTYVRDRENTRNRE